MLTHSILVAVLLAASTQASGSPPATAPRQTPSPRLVNPGAPPKPGGLPTAPPKPTATGDAEFDAVRTRFSDLSRWLGGKQELGADQRREIERCRGEIETYVAKHPDHAAALGMLIQTQAWLGDLEAANAGFAKLAALRPDDGAVLANWGTFWRNRNQFDRALAALRTFPADTGVFPQVATLSAECLLSLGRFDEAEQVLLAVPAATAARPDVSFNLERLKKMAAEYKEFWATEEALRAAEATADTLPRVEVTTDRGRMVMELFEDSAPNTVANFIDLVNKGFYDGTLFHRVIPAFMAQGGDPNSKHGSTGAVGTGGPGYRILGEATKPEARKHFPGTISMAHNGNPDNGGSQFFICFGPTGHLNGVHTAFGRVIEGMDVLLSTQQQDVIQSMKVLRKRDHEYKPETLDELPPPAPPTPPTGGAAPRPRVTPVPK